MSRAGKFVPGGGTRKTTNVEPGPIRAPDPSDTVPTGAPSGEPPKDGAKKKLAAPRLLGKKKGRFPTLPLPFILGLASILACSFIWYQFVVVPAQQRADHAEAEARQNQDRLAAALADEKAREEAEEKKLTEIRTSLMIDSNPPRATAILQGQRLTTPATFTNLKVGPVTVSLQKPGYEDFETTVNLAGDQPFSVGVVELKPRLGTLDLTSPTRDATYQLAGPNDYSHSGTLPDTLPNLVEGDYQLTPQTGDWQIDSIPIRIRKNEVTHQIVTFPFAHLQISSQPEGATIRSGRKILGTTPFNFGPLRPTTLNLTLDLFGYNIEHLTLVLSALSDTNQIVRLVRNRDFMTSGGMPMVWIPEGLFWAGKYDVRQSDYEALTGSNPSTFRKQDRPVETVSWDDAMAYCDRLTDSERRAGRLPGGYHFSLPTESQWASYSADADINLAATSRNTTLFSTQDVGFSEPNRYGLYDTLGNVWQWCRDNYDARGNHSLRGGGWLSSIDNFPSSDTRIGAPPSYADRFIGFRVVLVSNSEPAMADRQ